MLHGNIVKEKTTVLEYVNSVLDYSQVENELSCFKLAQNLVLPVPSPGCRLNSYSYSYSWFQAKTPAPTPAPGFAIPNLFKTTKYKTLPIYLYYKN